MTIFKQRNAANIEDHQDHVKGIWRTMQKIATEKKTYNQIALFR